MVAEGHRLRYPPASAERISTQSSFAERRCRVADEPVAVQVGDKRGMQPVRGDEFAEGRNLRRQRPQQLPQRVRLHFQPGDAGTLAWNAEKLNMHNVRASPEIDSMIELVHNDSMRNSMKIHSNRLLSDGDR